MSWIQKLNATYDNCRSMIGSGTEENEIPLLPICHSTQKAQIEIVIDQDGNFKRARVVPKEEARTIIPCTEASGGRAGIKPETHPLCDKLQYIAKDFDMYGGRVTKGYVKNPTEPCENYSALLTSWCLSQYSHPKVTAIKKYVDKGNVIRDLVDYQVLYTGNDGRLTKIWNGGKDTEIPDVFKLLPGKENKKTGEIENWQADAFVRWIVEMPNDPQSAVWKDPSLFKSWINYYSSIKGAPALCYVTGEILPLADQHPAKIRNDGDKAKLISSNDTSGFTFRGRFNTAEQACQVSFEVTQQAHNALRWLTGRQGYRRGDQAFVAWAVSGKEILDPLADSYSILDLDTLESDSDSESDTAQELAIKLRKKIAGYTTELGDTSGIVVMGLDSATPGRMAITYYRELTGSDFLARINSWHDSCCWVHNYRLKEVINPQTGQKKKLHPKFVGAPAPDDIAKAAYGEKVDDKLRKATVERIFPCIIDGQPVPRDLVESVVRRASNRVGMDDWEWKKALSIACALFRKYQRDYKKEVLEMALDPNRKTRDYLYGRLLALADSLEEWALNESGESRQTNAARFMQRFAEHPYTTWRNLELALSPSKARLGGKSFKRQQMISEVMTLFEPDEFTNDKKLSGEFLLAYHSQREALRKKGED